LSCNSHVWFLGFVFSGGRPAQCSRVRSYGDEPAQHGWFTKAFMCLVSTVYGCGDNRSWALSAALISDETSLVCSKPALAE
jgi:hypothetical protein